jgi:hypothetical protein
VTELKRFSLVKPTLQTKFHIDFEWWSQNDRDWRVYLQNLLCLEHQQAFNEMSSDDMVDWVDPDTAEIQRVDGLQNILIAHCAKDPNFITEHTAMVDAVFRLFLANGNAPQTILELAERLKRPGEVILRTLASGRVYRGLRPYIEG